MKAITPIIAILVLLLITVSVAGAAWAYLSGYFGGMISKGVELMSIDCTATGVIIYVNNIGTDRLYMNDDMNIIREMVYGDCVTAMNISYIPAEIGPGNTGQIIDDGCNSSVKATPRYRVLAGGRVQTTQVNC